MMARGGDKRRHRNNNDSNTSERAGDDASRQQQNASQGAEPTHSRPEALDDEIQSLNGVPGVSFGPWMWDPSRQHWICRVMACVDGDKCSVGAANCDIYVHKYKNGSQDLRHRNRDQVHEATGSQPQGDRSRRRAGRPRSRSPFRRSRSPSYRNRDRSTSRRRNRDYDNVRSTEVPDSAEGLAGNDKDQQVCRSYPDCTCREGERCTFQHIGPARANSASHDADRTSAIAPADTYGGTRTHAYPDLNSLASSDLRAGIRNLLLCGGCSEAKVDEVMSPDNRTRAPDDYSAQPQAHLQSEQSLQPQQNLASRQHMPMVKSEPSPDHITTQQYARPEQHARPGHYMMPHQNFAEQQQPPWQSATPQAHADLQRHSVSFGVPPNNRLRSMGQELPHPDSAHQYGGTADHHLSPRVRRGPDLDDGESTPIKREDDDDIWAVNE